MTKLSRRCFLTRGMAGAGMLAGASAIGGALLTTRMAFGAPEQ